VGDINDKIIGVALSRLVR